MRKILCARLSLFFKEISSKPPGIFSRFGTDFFKKQTQTGELNLQHYSPRMLVILTSLSLLLLNACATPIGRSNRLGLFDQLEGGSGNASRSRGIRSVKEEDLVEAPDPTAVLKLSGDWQWPLERVDPSSLFGERGKKFHQGIDLRAATGTPVFAASRGKILYAGSKVRGYGRMIVIKHENNIFTVYGHHSKNLVKVGTEVNRGDVIAYSGRSGRAHGPHLHFEIRKGTMGFDPQLALNQHISDNPVDRRFASVVTEPIRRKKISRRNQRRVQRTQNL